MRAAVIRELGQPPEVTDAAEPADDVAVEVLAAALNPIDLAVSSGRNPAGHPPLPFVPGCEGVGRKRDGGELVWLFGGGLGIQRDGTMAELASAPESAVHRVPDDADPALAVACGIAGLAGWMPVAWRAPVRRGETVLVLGATGVVGSVALQAAKLLGAGRVIAAGRDRGALDRARELGADDAIELDQIPTLAETPPTLIVDPLFGEPAVAASEVAARGARIVQLGQSAGATAALTSAAIRFKGLEILGYSNFNVSRDELEREYARLVRHVTAGEITIDVDRIPLDDVASAWERQAASPHRKLVITF